MSDNLEDLLSYMPEIEGYEKQLITLDDAWENIKLMTEVSCPVEAKTILPSMTSTQRGFQDLQKRLVENLVLESLNKQTRELASRAQVAVDILIRNLFERTADVGFLATDADIRKFLVQNSADHREQTFIKQRLLEYVKKYTVYEEIVILDSDLKVRANLDVSNPISDLIIDDPLLRKALSTTEPYIENYAHSRLQPNKTCSLTYSCQIRQSNDSKAPIIGLLVLCFRFANEMEGIFKKLSIPGQDAVISILDSQGVVIASSDPFHLPLGARMNQPLSNEYQIVNFHGLEYITKTCPTKGYQGYSGLGWLGHAMVPAGLAFQRRRASRLDKSDTKILDRIISQSTSFSPALGEIGRKADNINLSLRRVVWNGQVMSTSDGDNSLGSGQRASNKLVSDNTNYEKLKALLNQISRLGIKTSKLFGESIANLYQTVISSTLSAVQFHASLAIDIMDRNLYERADDCRWWALTSDFRVILQNEILTSDDRRRITDILRYINSLYTVYTSIFVYDRKGCVIAVSSDQLEHLVGTTLDTAWVQQTLSLRETQKYCVSPFEQSCLYNNEYTYIYGASITGLDSGKTIVGGIGLVFDSEPQFKAILCDSLPSNNDCFALFAQRDHMIISSSNPSYPVGTQIEISHDLLALENGCGMSKIIAHQDSYWAVGSMTSSGYREYKNTGDYKNDVIALLFVKLGTVTEELSKASARKDMGERYFAKTFSGELAKLATFFVNSRRYAIVADFILEAVGCEGITWLPDAPAAIEGLLHYQEGIIRVINLATLLSSSSKLDNKSIGNSKLSQVIVFRSSEGNFGLLVDELDYVVEVEKNLIAPKKTELQSSMQFVQAVVNLDDSNDESLVVVLDPARIVSSIFPNFSKTAETTALT